MVPSVAVRVETPSEVPKMNSIKTPFGFCAVTILCVVTLGIGPLFAEAGVAPPIIDGLVLGYDGSDATIDGGGYVTSWIDQAVGGGIHNAIAPVTGIDGNSPLLDTVNTLNGNNVLLFDGIYDYTAGDVLSTSYTPSAGVSFFTVFRRDAQTTGGSSLRPIIGANTLEIAGIAVIAGTTNNNTVNARYNDVQVNGTGVGDGQYHVVSSIGTTGTDGIVLTIDGAVKATNTTASHPPSPSNVEIGGQDNSDARRFAGPIAEVLVYDRALTNIERIEVEGYLGEKYGLFGSMAVPVTDLPISSGLKAHFDADHAQTDAAGDVDFWMSRTMDGTRADKYSTRPSGELIEGEVNGHNVVRFNPTPAAGPTGLDEVLRTNYTPQLGEDLTVFVVAKQSGQNYPSSSGIKVITSSGTLSAGAGVFRFGNMTSNKNKLEISSHGHEYETVSTTFSDGSYHFMTGLVDNGVRVQGFYDGERTLAETVSGTPPVSAFQIGGDTGSADRGFSGDIGEVIVFNRELSAGERARIEGYLYLKYFDQATSDPNTLGYWHFDRQTIGQSVGVDGLIVDYSGRHNHATAQGGSLEVVDGESLQADDSALRFGSDADRMVVPHSDDFEFDAATESFTIEAMIRTTMTDGGAIYAKQTSGGEPEYWLRVNGGIIQSIFRDDVTPTPNSVSCYGDEVVNDGDWHHVATVFDAATDKIQLYVDYELDKTSNASGLTGIIGGNGLDLFIGRFQGGSSVFDGDIDFVRISSVALDPSEFLQRYVPEPSSILLLACGLAVAIGRRPQRRKSRCS